jgi:hypothetical protein
MLSMEQSSFPVFEFSSDGILDPAFNNDWWPGGLFEERRDWQVT